MIDQISSALQTHSFHKLKIKEFSEQLERAETRIQKWILEDQGLEEKLQLTETSQVFYRKAIDLVYARSIGELEATINSALSFIFFDRSYSIRFELGDQRGKSMELFLLDTSDGRNRVVDMKDGVGNGVRSVVSYVLLTLHLTARGIPPILFLDEAYSAISESYVDRFFTFVRGLSLTKQAPLILISHDDRFLPYADQRIRVSNGVVQFLN